MDQGTGEYVLQLHIALGGVEPAVWRRVLVPGDSLLSEMAETLLSTMGWQNSHLHQFEVGDELYGMHVDDYPEEEIDESTVPRPLDRVTGPPFIVGPRRLFYTTASPC